MALYDALDSDEIDCFLNSVASPRFVNEIIFGDSQPVNRGTLDSVRTDFTSISSGTPLPQDREFRENYGTFGYFVQEAA